MRPCFEKKRYFSSLSGLDSLREFVRSIGFKKNFLKDSIYENTIRPLQNRNVIGSRACILVNLASRSAAY